MAFMIIWIVQMLVFFLFISGIVFLFSKKMKQSGQQNKSRPENTQRPVESEWAPLEQRQAERNQQQSRNVRQNRNQSTHSERKEKEHRDRRQELKDHRADRLKNRRFAHIEQKEKPALQNITPLENKKKKKSKGAIFKRSNLKQAVLYKEILDKPLSLRDE